MNVLIINQCSTNKGDRAVLYFVLRELKAGGIKDITVSASNPQYWRDTPDFPDASVHIVPWGWDVSRRKDAGFLAKVFHLLIKIKLPGIVYFPLVRRAIVSEKFPGYIKRFINEDFRKAVEKADLVISTGGHHLTTIIAKSIKTPQIFDMAVALLYKKSLLLWSQSIGTFTFDCPASRAMVKKILTKAAQIYIRDETSAGEIQKLGIEDKETVKTYESVFGLYDVVKSRVQPSARPNIIGVSVWTGNKHNSRDWGNYIQCFARLINYAIYKTGCKIRFFPMEMQGSDRLCIEEIINTIYDKDSCEIVEGFPCTVEHINEVSKCRLFIGHKTHSQIFALVSATPLLAIAYHKKTNDFMTQFGLGDCCIADTQFNSDRLIQIFDYIIENLDFISRSQHETAGKISEQVKKDFAQMLSYHSKETH
jgi:colanic acid/amylovoran biosynthesis protein